MTHHNEISMQSCLGLFIKLPSHIPWADRRGPLAIQTVPGYSLPTEISDFPRKYTGKKDGALKP